MSDSSGSSTTASSTDDSSTLSVMYPRVAVGDLTIQRPIQGPAFPPSFQSYEAYEELPEPPSPSPPPPSSSSYAQEGESEEQPSRLETLLLQISPYLPCRSVDNYEKLNKIEEGSYGMVFRGKDLQTNEVVALKKVKMDKEREGFPKTSLREIKILMQLNHPNILHAKEIVVGSSLDSIFIVMEYLDHDLRALMLSMKTHFSIAEVKCLMLQLLSGVAFLHDNWILHRDLKTSNLLMNNKGVLKIADFGLSREYGSPLKCYTDLVVTLWYRAPELLLGAKKYSTAIDMWSVGCILAELLTKQPLFSGQGEMEQLQLIFKMLGSPNERNWPELMELPLARKINFPNQPFNNLSIQYSASSTTALSSTSSHPRLSPSGMDLLNRMLTYDPKQRITATEALKHPYWNEEPQAIDPELMPIFPSRFDPYSRKRRKPNEDS